MEETLTWSRARLQRAEEEPAAQVELAWVSKKAMMRINKTAVKSGRIIIIRKDEHSARKDETIWYCAQFVLLARGGRRCALPLTLLLPVPQNRTS